MAVLVFYIVTAAILATGYSLPSAGHTCQHTMTPPTNAKGVNHLDRSSDLPLFRLKIVNLPTANSSQDNSSTYTVQISAENEHFPFTDVKISMTTEGQCETGSLTFDPHHFFDTKQSSHVCPRLLLISRKLPMLNLPSLSWRPPVCGCVKFRALVISVDNAYYVDNEEVENGPLSQTICVQQQVSRELYLNTLCRVREKYSAAEIISRASFLQRHQLETRWMDKHGLEMGLELRRSDNRLCCSKSSLEATLSCFDDARRRRVDRFCEDGYPDIPFTSFRLNHMRERERMCCFLLGEHRYTCFAERSDLMSGPAVTLLDFSQDETDPVNDLAEFASLQDADVVKSIKSVALGDKDSKEDNASEEDHEDDTNNDDEKNDDDIKHKHQIPKLTNGKNRAQSEGIKSTLDVSSAPVDGARESSTVPRPSSAERSRPNTKMAGDIESPTLTSSDRLQKSSRETDRRYSGERTSSRRASSREYTADGRPAGAEKAGRKRASAERFNPSTRKHSRIPGYENTYSRGTGVSREREPMSSAERRNWARTSAERRNRARTSAQKRQDWLEVDEPDFEDQGGKSVEVTLDKLQKRMERLQLRKRCCKAGAVAGDPVYGWLYNVRKECEDSLNKYISGNRIKFGARVCHDEFLKCCREKATSGPVATSSEFKDSQFLFMNNLKKLGPVRSVSQLERQEDGDEAAEDLHQAETSRDVPGQETFEGYERESERRFKSMRDFDEAPRDNNDDEEYDGPKRFDETDNDLSKEVDILHRKDDTLNLTVISMIEKPGELGEEYDATGKDVGDSGDSKKVNSESSNENNKLKIGSGIKRKQNKKPVTKDHLDRVSDLVSGLDTSDSDTVTSREDSLLAKTSGGKSTYFRNNQRGGRSQGGRSNSQESRYRSLMTESRTTKSPERHHSSHTSHGNKRGYKNRLSGKIGTEDSQEMAAAHVRKFLATLDSKEMTEAYKKTNADVSDVLNDGPRLRSSGRRKLHRQRWYY